MERVYRCRRMSAAEWANFVGSMVLGGLIVHAAYRLSRKFRRKK